MALSRTDPTIALHYVRGGNDVHVDIKHCLVAAFLEMACNLYTQERMRVRSLPNYCHGAKQYLGTNKTVRLRK